MLFADIRELHKLVPYAFYYIEMDKNQHASVKTSSPSSRFGFQESRKDGIKEFGCGKSNRSMKVELRTDWPDRSLFNAVYLSQKGYHCSPFLSNHEKCPSHQKHNDKKRIIQIKELK